MDDTGILLNKLVVAGVNVTITRESAAYAHCTLARGNISASDSSTSACSALWAATQAATAAGWLKPEEIQ